jgi:hypothetical protein
MRKVQPRFNINGWCCPDGTVVFTGGSTNILLAFHFLCMSYKREADKATFKARGNVAREKVAKWSSYSKWNFENKL